MKGLLHGCEGVGKGGLSFRGEPFWRLWQFNLHSLLVLHYEAWRGHHEGFGGFGGYSGFGHLGISDLTDIQQLFCQTLGGWGFQMKLRTEGVRAPSLIILLKVQGGCMRLAVSTGGAWANTSFLWQGQGRIPHTRATSARIFKGLDGILHLM